MAFVLPTLNSGGAERAALNLAAAAPQSHCTVVAEASGGNLATDPLASNVVVASVSLPLSRAARIYRLARVLRRLRPDLVVAMLSPLVSTGAGAVAGVPVMHWLQAPWSRTTAAGGDGLLPEVERLLLRLVGQRAHLIMGAAPGLLEECLSLGLPAAKLALLPNGIVLPPFSERLRRNDRARIVSVGRLEPPKRHDLLLEAVGSLCGERELELVLVGSGAHERELKARAEALNIAKHVKFTGFVSDPHRYVATADVFALATDYEGFGNVIVEALACGVPAVVSDVPYGPRFILGPTSMGRLVEPGSAMALAEGLRIALDRPPTTEKRVEGRRRAEDFAVERVARRFEEFVDLVLEGRGDAPKRQVTSWP